MKKFAMIFAAGLGTRLGELSKTTPKALVPLAGKPLLYHILKKVKTYGFNQIVINIHHHADQVINFIQNNEFEGLNIFVSYEQDLLLDTGGGLKKAEILLEEADNFLLYNVDIISSIDLDLLYQKHINCKSIATLAIQNRKSNRAFLFNDNLHLKGWQNINTNEKRVYSDTPLTPFAFSGIHVLSKEIFKYMPSDILFSMTDFYLTICENINILGHLHSEDLWIDVGQESKFSQAESILNMPIYK